MTSREYWLICTIDDQDDGAVMVLHSPSLLSTDFPSLDAAKAAFPWVDWTELTATNVARLGFEHVTNSVAVGYTRVDPASGAELDPLERRIWRVQQFDRSVARHRRIYPNDPRYR